MYVCVHVCMYVHIYVCMYRSIYTCMYVCVCMYVCEEVASDLGFGGGFCRVLSFSLPVVTG